MAKKMLTALTKTLDQQRAFEVIDFVMVFALLLAVSMLVLFLLFLIRSRTLHRELRVSSAEVYYFLLPTLALDVNDHKLIKRMADFLPFPQQKHRIMVNTQIFDSCARRLVAEEQANETVLRNLRRKLGFPAGAEGIMPASSLDLATDLPVLLVQKGKSAVRGIVLSNTELSLAIMVDDDSASPLINGPINVYFQNRAGFFTFPTQVTGRDDLVIRLQHSERIKRYQRRRYSRKQVQLPVFVRPYQGGSRTVKSVFVDLSGGGASLRNPGQQFQIEQQIELSFAPHGEKFVSPQRTMGNGFF
ncbi:hypothetical protein ES705_21840 [subsurface metagenome]